MSYLDNLLKNVHVEWTALGKIADIYDGTHQTPKYKDFGVPFVSVQNIEDLYGTQKYISDKDFDQFKYKPQKDDVFMTRIGDIGTCAIVKDDKPLAYYVTLTLIRVNQNYISSRFLKYIIEGKIGKEELYKRTLINATPIKINLGEIGKIIIPIPSLEIQKEIIRILDTFSLLTTETITGLKMELAARKKQYKYYRDKLFTEAGEFEWKTLGEIGDVKMCKRILKSETKSQGDVPFYKIGTFGKQANAYISQGIYDEYRNRYSFPQKGDILISASGTIGRTVVYNGEPAYFQDSNIVWIENDESIVSNKYLWHFYKIAKWFVSGGGTIDRLYNDNLRKTKIPIPNISDPKRSLIEQNRIVAILDKFETLTTSISDDLSKEIMLRQKQYEYYRDMLLTFSKDNLKA